MPIPCATCGAKAQVLCTCIKPYKPVKSNRKVVMDITALNAAIEKIDETLKSQPKERLEVVNRALNITSEELFTWQELKSVAQASNKISLDVAMFLFTTIGTNPKHFNKQSIAKKYLVTNIMKNLMEWKMGL